MIQKKQKTTQLGMIHIDTSPLSQAAEKLSSCLIPNTGFGLRKSSTSPNKTSKRCITYIISGYAAELVVKRTLDKEVEASSLFVNPRKQEPFDWVKNTNAYQRIIHLSDLENKWDGYNAPTFSKEQIDLALTLYSHLRTYSIQKALDFPKIEPFIAPGSDGMILFEWAGKRFPARQLEIYVPASTEHQFQYLKTENESESEGEFSLDGLYPILDWLFKFEC